MAIDLAKTKGIEISKKNIFKAAVGFVCLVVFIALWMFMVSPKVSEIKTIKKRTNQISNINEGIIPTMGKEKYALEQNKKLLLDRVLSIEEGLKTQKDISAILDKFILTAKKRKLEFTYIKPLAKKNITITKDRMTMNLKEIPVSLEMEATFTDFLDFLWETEHLEQILAIAELSVDNNPSSAFRHKEKITLSVYELEGEIQDGR